MIILLSVGGVILWSASRWRHQDNEMGCVSTQWLAEYRQNHES
jgi:hypothetical protein